MILLKKENRIEYPENMIEEVQRVYKGTIFYIPSYFYKMICVMENFIPLLNILKVREALFISIDIENEEESSKDIDEWREQVKFQVLL